MLRAGLVAATTRPIWRWSRRATPASRCTWSGYGRCCARRPERGRPALPARPAAVRRRPGTPCCAAAAGRRRCYMNCSGKHAGMLLTCLAAGWPLDRTTATPATRCSRRAGTAVEDLAGEPVAAVGVDGCGAPVLAISLTGLARAFLAPGRAPSPAPPERTRGRRDAGPPRAGLRHRRDDARLMRGVPGLLVQGRRRGCRRGRRCPASGAVALKIDDGAMRARMPVAGRRRCAGWASTRRCWTSWPSPVLGGGAGRSVRVAGLGTG